VDLSFHLRRSVKRQGYRASSQIERVELRPESVDRFIYL